MNFDDLLTSAARNFEFFFPYPLDESMEKERDNELSEIKVAIEKYKKLKGNPIEEIFFFYLKIFMANKGTQVAIDIINKLFIDSPTLESSKSMAGLVAGFAVIAVQFYKNEYYNDYDRKIKKISRPKLLKLHRRWVRAGKVSVDADQPRLVIY